MTYFVIISSDEVDKIQIIPRYIVIKKVMIDKGIAVEQLKNLLQIERNKGE